MDPRDFLKLAENLVVSKNAGPSYFRAAIGRAYYAAFNVASQVLRALGFPPAQSPVGHAHAVRLLQRSGDAALATVGGLLGDLHGDRIKADYELQRTDVEKMQTAQAAVEIADSILRDLDTFMADPARKSAVTGTLSPLYKSITGKSQ